MLLISLSGLKKRSVGSITAFEGNLLEKSLLVQLVGHYENRLYPRLAGVQANVLVNLYVLLVNNSGERVKRMLARGQMFQWTSGMKPSNETYSTMEQNALKVVDSPGGEIFKQSLRDHLSEMQ